MFNMQGYYVFAAQYRWNQAKEWRELQHFIHSIITLRTFKCLIFFPEAFTSALLY